MRSMFATDIFKDELSLIYQNKDQVKADLKNEIKVLLNKLDSVPENESLNHMMIELNHDLASHKGRLSYGYLSKPLKAKVDNIMQEIEKIPEVSELLKKWKELLKLQYSLYSDEREPENSFVHDKAFRPLKNQIIQAASNLIITHSEDESIEYSLSAVLDEPTDESQSKNAHSEYSYIKITALLLKHLSSLVRKEIKVSQPSLKSDRNLKLKTKLLKMALGQNENDTQQFS